MAHQQHPHHRFLTGGFDRRTFLKASAGTSAMLVVSSAFALDALAQDAQSGPLITGYQFFTTPQAQTVGAMAERIWPATEQSAGAIEAGVVFYIDHALAGDYRRFQSDYLHGIELIDAMARSEHDAAFAGLSEEQQQSLLERIDTGDLGTAERAEEQQGLAGLAPSVQQVESQQSEDDAAQDEAPGATAPARDSVEEPAPSMHQAAGAVTGAAAQPSVASQLGIGGAQVAGLTPPEDASLLAFFNLVYTHTMEGLFSDPIYGGNRDFAGWRAVSYPGAHYVYTEEEQQSFEPLDKPIQSIADI